MSIGIGQRTFAGGRLDAQMVELAMGDTQPLTDFAEAFGLGELAEKHRDTLCPAGKSLAVAVGFGLTHQACEGSAGNQLQDLAE